MEQTKSSDEKLSPPSPPTYAKASAGKPPSPAGGEGTTGEELERKMKVEPARDALVLCDKDAPAGKPQPAESRTATDRVRESGATELALKKEAEAKGRASNLSYGAPVAAAKAPAIAPASLVIREKGAWANVWMCQNTAQNINQPVPPVDFKKQMAIAVPSRNDGVEYQVVKTEEKPEKIVVLYKEVPAQKRAEPLPPYQINVVNSKPSVEFQRIP